MRYSIIVPIYNARDYLRECLDSVLSQVCSDWECICVNDGSDDFSPFILDEYIKKDSRFKVVTNGHNGVGTARNAGVAVAKGDYVLFLDADDTLLPEALDGLSAETADIVSFLPLKKSGVFDSLAGNMIAWNAMYRRDVVADVRFPDFVNCEDLVFAAEAYARAKSVVVGVKPWYCHRDVPGSACNSHSWRRVADSWKSIGMMERAYRPILKGVRMRLILCKKLTMHFLLHVVAEVPWAMKECARKFMRRVFTLH